MRKIIIVLFLILAFTYLKAEDEYYYNKLKANEFIEWMQSVKIPGFILDEPQILGSEQTYNLEYSCNFSNNNYEVITARIGHPDVFYTYEDLKTHEKVGPYNLDGFVSVFIYNQRVTKPSSLTYLLVQMPEIHATFSITALTKERLTQEKMEAYFRCFMLKTVDDDKTITWAEDIPIAIRLPGELSEISTIGTKDELVKQEYSVKIIKTEDFLKGLRKFYQEKRGWLDLTTYNNITLICKTTSDFKALEKMKDGEPIEFVYYIK